MRIKRILAISLCLIMILTLNACGKSNSQLDERKEVVAMEVKLEKEIERSEFSGTLQAMEETTYSFEVPGRIKNMNVAEGSKVKVGDILAELDEESYKLQVNMAEANVMNASAVLSQTSNGARAQEITIAKSKLDQAYAAYQKASDDFKRNKELYKAGAISLSQYEALKTQLTIAEKDMVSAQEAYSLTTEGARKEQRDQAAAAYGSAITSKDQAALALSKTQLKSPISGTIISKYVTKDQIAAAGTPIFKIANIESLKVVLPVPDYEISKWKAGDKITATLYGRSKEGTVTKVFPSISEGTATVGVEVRIENKENDWLPGQVITCIHTNQGKDAIFIPSESVISNGNGNPYVFIVENDIAIKTFVVTGRLKNSKLEISSGLESGDKVVVKGGGRLFDKDKIKVVGG